MYAAILSVLVCPLFMIRSSSSLDALESVLTPINDQKFFRAKRWHNFGKHKSPARSLSGVSPLKCVDMGGAKGCSVQFKNWRQSNQISDNDLVCGVIIQAKVRTHPFACQSYSITDVTLENSQHAAFAVTFTSPDPGDDCSDFQDLKIKVFNNTDLQAFFCGSGLQPYSCKNTWPTLNIRTTQWNKTICHKYMCEDDIPLTLSLQLDIPTLPKSMCPRYNDMICGGNFGRNDSLNRGDCGCSSIRESRWKPGTPTTTCNCYYGYFGDACQFSCPGGIVQKGNFGLSGCCNDNGKVHYSKDDKEHPVTCVCRGNFGGEACEKCKAGWSGESCTKKVPSSHGTKPDFPYIVIALSSGLAFVCMVVAALYCYCRERRTTVSADGLTEELIEGSMRIGRHQLKENSVPLSSHLNDSGLFGKESADQSGQLIRSLLATEGPLPEKAETETTSKVVAEIDRLSQSNIQYMIDYDALIIGSKIGTGTSGEVFQAEICFDSIVTNKGNGKDGTTNRKDTPARLMVALKKLNSQTVNRTYFMNAFKRELAVLRQMEHPNIVRFIGIAISPTPDKSYHVVTELCRCALSDLLERGKGKIPPLILASICLQIAEGMCYLHAENVVHRDLKPANCLCAGGGSGGGSLRIKICDFGMSRLVSNDVTFMTADIGTPAYMAPEMASEGDISSVEAGKAIDVFSFAVCLLEIWTQKRPYDGESLNVFQLMIKVINGSRPSIPGPSIVPQMVAKTIESSWRREPLLRPSFKEILQTMQNTPQFFKLQ